MRRFRAFILTLLSVVVAGAGLSVIGIPASGQSASPDQSPLSSARPKPSLRTLVLGVSMAPDSSLQALDGFIESMDGHAPGIWSLWSSWGGADAEFPDPTLLDGIVARGAVPMLFWQPNNPSNPDDPLYAYSRIIAGDHDAYLRRWAQAARQWGGPILAKFAHEMNATWFPWAVGRFDNTPATFRLAWQHIWQITREEGATNVYFLWSPFGCPPCEVYAEFYPGDEFVDFAGVSQFDWNGDASMELVLSAPMDAITRLTTRPIIVAEIGTPAGPGKAAWIRKGYRAVYRAYPQVRAVVYFNVDSRYAGQPDWRLDQPPEALAAYGELYDHPRFDGSLDLVGASPQATPSAPPSPSPSFP